MSQAANPVMFEMVLALAGESNLARAK
jgi:hypothetical protein